jgi:hypothetical protein
LGVCTREGLDVKSAECAKLMKKDRITRYRPVYDQLRDWNLINVFTEGE